MTDWFLEEWIGKIRMLLENDVFVFGITTTIVRGTS